MNDLEQTILANLNTFVAFARNRINDLELAADVVQESLLKALQASDKPSDNQKVVQWFYRILRNSIIDLYRRSDTRKRAMERFEAEFAELPTVEDERTLCNCFRRLIPTLPESYQEVLERVELRGEDPAAVATALNIKPNNLNVRLFRARKQLKERLEQTCQACSKHGCLDCTCG
jgi:RNA polymerase sigma factor (sigma-70 family)